ncbi:MAG: hypothetical protein ACPG31_04525 [Planctomycetota bacterium]
MSEVRNNLQADMARFERRLRETWSLQVPCVPQHLQSYHQAWQDTLAAPLQEATEQEMTRALRKAEVLLISDFHPSRRSRSGLAQLLARLPQDRPLILGLELLPHGTTLTLAEASRGAGPMLMTGQSLIDAYGMVLEALAGRQVYLVGTWVDGSVQRRDEAAAAVWERVRRKHGRFHCALHFGDWHLADSALPKRLRDAGSEVMTIHQSPEPIWERVGLRPPGHVYRLQQNHWAWLQTPPLSLWANHLQDLSDHDAEATAEAAEHLCESASELLAATLGLEAPECRLTIATPERWQDFHAHLPRRLAEAYPRDAAPDYPLFHPRLPILWSPGNLDHAQLIEGAAHCLQCSSPLQMEVGPLPELRRQAFRSLCAYLVNPFLHQEDLLSLAERMVPDPQRRADVLAEARRAIGAPESWMGLSAAAEELLLRHAGQATASVWARRPQLDSSGMKEFLDPRSGVFDWEAVKATIRVA